MRVLGGGWHVGSVQLVSIGFVLEPSPVAYPVFLSQSDVYTREFASFRLYHTLNEVVLDTPSFAQVNS